MGNDEIWVRKVGGIMANWLDIGKRSHIPPIPQGLVLISGTSENEFKEAVKMWNKRDDMFVTAYNTVYLSCVGMNNKHCDYCGQPVRRENEDKPCQYCGAPI